MKTIFSTGDTGKNDLEIREGLLGHLKKFEEGGWLLLAVRHMNLKKRKWLAEPVRLEESSYYKAFKGWLANSSIPVSFKSKMDGLVAYNGVDGSDTEDFIESIGFDFILNKGDQVAMVSYARHRFNNEVFDAAVGRTGYNIVIFEGKEEFLSHTSKDME